MTAATAPRDIAFSTFAAKVAEPREMTAMLPATLAGQSAALSARPQLTSVPVTPWALVAPPNSADSATTFPTAASRPVPVGTDDATSTPGASSVPTGTGRDAAVGNV